MLGFTDSRLTVIVESQFALQAEASTIYPGRPGLVELQWLQLLGCTVWIVKCGHQPWNNYIVSAFLPQTPQPPIYFTPYKCLIRLYQ